MPAAKKKRTIQRPVHFETTIPVIRPCASCGVWFAAGRAEGMLAEVEFVPLDLGQQLWAIMNKIELYCIRRSGLVHMDACRLGGRRFGAIYPQHRCEVRWPIPAPEDHSEHQKAIPPY